MSESARAPIRYCNNEQALMKQHKKWKNAEAEKPGNFSASTDSPNIFNANCSEQRTCRVTDVGVANSSSGYGGFRCMTADGRECWVPEGSVVFVPMVVPVENCTQVSTEFRRHPDWEEEEEKHPEATWGKKKGWHWRAPIGSAGKKEGDGHWRANQRRKALRARRKNSVHKSGPMHRPR